MVVSPGSWNVAVSVTTFPILNGCYFSLYFLASLLGWSCSLSGPSIVFSASFVLLQIVNIFIYFRCLRCLNVCGYLTAVLVLSFSFTMLSIILQHFVVRECLCVIWLGKTIFIRSISVSWQSLFMLFMLCQITLKLGLPWLIFCSLRINVSLLYLCLFSISYQGKWQEDADFFKFFDVL